MIVVCRRCARRERFNVARLMAAHGDVQLPHLLTILTWEGCEGRDSWGGCGLVYEDPPGARAGVSAGQPRAVHPDLLKGRMTLGQAAALSIKLE